jgi:CRP/FNR family transcriptional regulator, cyclic AMP receptor protein
VEPELGNGLAVGEREEARRLVVLPTLSLEAEAWDVRDLDRAEGVRGDVLGFAVLSGAVAMDVWLARRTCTRLIGAGELVLLDGAERDSVPVSWGWSVIVPARLAVFDERLLAIGQRWPRLLAAVLQRAAQQTRNALLQQAISQLPRVEDRLLALFWALADRHGVVRRDGIWVELPATHDTIARMIGARRPTVSLGLASLAERGLLRAEGSEWVIDRASLDHFAEPGDGVPTAAGTKARSRSDRSPAPAARPALISIPELTAPTRGPPRVLMVAADASALDCSAEGWVIVNVHDASAALVALDQSEPDLVVLDVSLLGASDSGPGLLERLRIGGALHPSRLMLIDMGVSSAALPAALAAAAHDYVRGPVVSADLQGRIQAQLTLGAAQGGATHDRAGHDGTGHGTGHDARVRNGNALSA